MPATTISEDKKTLELVCCCLNFLFLSLFVNGFVPSYLLMRGKFSCFLPGVVVIEDLPHSLMCPNFFTSLGIHIDECPM